MNVISVKGRYSHRATMHSVTVRRTDRRTTWRCQ